MVSNRAFGLRPSFQPTVWKCWNGSTPEAEGFRDVHAEFELLGYEIFGLSSQSSDNQHAFAARAGTAQGSAAVSCSQAAGSVSATARMRQTEATHPRASSSGIVRSNDEMRA